MTCLFSPVSNRFQRRCRSNSSTLEGNRLITSGRLRLDTEHINYPNPPCVPLVRSHSSSPSSPPVVAPRYVRGMYELDGPTPAYLNKTGQQRRAQAQPVAVVVHLERRHPRTNKS